MSRLKTKYLSFNTAHAMFEEVELIPATILPDFEWNWSLYVQQPVTKTQLLPHETNTNENQIPSYLPFTYSST